MIFKIRQTTYLGTMLLLSPDITKTIDEPKYTCEELAIAHKLHASTIRKMFIEEEGVIRIGHPCLGRGRKRQYFTLRIPASVAARVFAKLTVGGPNNVA